MIKQNGVISIDKTLKKNWFISRIGSNRAIQ